LVKTGKILECAKLDLTKEKKIFISSNKIERKGIKKKYRQGKTSKQQIEFRNASYKSSKRFESIHCILIF
jgi:hypothetical protein